MAKSEKTVEQTNPGMMFVISIVVVALINALVVYLANMFFPNQVVLGTMSISRLWSLAIFSTALSLFTVMALPFLKQMEISRGKEMSPPEMMGAFLVINFIVVWLLSRVSEVFGVGVASWMVVLALSVVFDVLQGGVMVAIDKVRTGK